ncbi:unnamed protein product, partial [marine sediment metagenome]
DLELESIKITKDKESKTYNSSWKDILEKGQKQFDDYLSRIKEKNISEGLNNLN